MSELEVEGKTVEEAIREGLLKLRCSKENVDVKILNEGTSGLFGLMGNKPARVKLSPKAPSRADIIDYTLVQNKVKEILSTILKGMGISFEEINTALMAGRVMIEIKTKESNILIGKNGQTMEAVEHVLNLILSHDPATRTKVSIDTENYRSRQEERIQNIARMSANTVKETGKTFRFDPMPARDRKIIHMYLKNDDQLETFSEGEGMFRKVGIKLIK